MYNFTSQFPKFNLKFFKCFIVINIYFFFNMIFCQHRNFAEKIPIGNLNMNNKCAIIRILDIFHFSFLLIFE